MSTYTAWVAITAHLTAVWTATPLRFENGDSSPPADVTPYVLIRTSSTSSAQTSIGAGSISANRWQESGEVEAFIFVKHGEGMSLALQYAEQLMLIFRGLTVSPGIVFGDVSILEGERDGKWFFVTVLAPWERQF